MFELFLGFNCWLRVLVSLVFFVELLFDKCLKVNWWFKFLFMKWMFVVMVVLLVMFNEIFSLLNCEGSLNCC